MKWKKKKNLLFLSGQVEGREGRVERKGDKKMIGWERGKDE